MNEKNRLPAEARKRLIIRASISVFSESNYRLAKVAEIASLAGVTEPMVYKYYKSKKNLFLETLSKIGERVIEKIEDILDKEAPSLDNLQVVVKSYIQSMNKYEKELRIFYQAISEINDPEVKQHLQEIYRSYASFFLRIIESGVATGEFNKSINSSEVSWRLVGTLIHISTFYLLDLYDPRQAEYSIESLFMELK